MGLQQACDGTLGELSSSDSKLAAPESPGYVGARLAMLHGSNKDSLVCLQGNRAFIQTPPALFYSVSFDCSCSASSIGLVLTLASIPRGRCPQI